jgi:RNA polymerase sigma-70 factor (ECF subfamily)
MNASAKFIAEITAAQRQLHAFVAAIVWNLADADEVLQETNLAIWQKAAEYDPSRPFVPWAMRFAQVQAQSWLKKRKRVPVVFDDLLLERMVSEAIEEAGEFDAQRRALADCLQKLSADHRELIASRYEPEASVNDLAAARNVAPKALSELLRRIRSKLLACIDKTLAEGAYT